MPSSKTLIKRDSVYIRENMHKNALIKAMRLHGLTATKVIKPIIEALQANKVIITGKDEDAFAEVQPDHTTRLRAAQLGIQLLELTKDSQAKDPTQSPTITKDIQKALNNGDEVELQRVIFNKKDD